MSDFSQIMVEAILTAIFGVWIAAMTNIWEDGSKEIKAVIVAITVIAFLIVIVFAGYKKWISLKKKAFFVLVTIIVFLAVIIVAGYNEWISLPKIERGSQQTEMMESSEEETVSLPDTGDTDAVDKPMEDLATSNAEDTSNLMKKDTPKRLLKIVKGLIILILSFMFESVLWGLLASLLNSLIFKNSSGKYAISLCISGLILLVSLPFIEYFIFHVDMNFAGMLSVVTALLFGVSPEIINELVSDDMSDSDNMSGGLIGIISRAYSYMLLSYAIFVFLATRQSMELLKPLDIFKWITNTFVFFFG